MKGGFTLLEVLVALAIFSILSALAFNGLGRSLTMTRRLTEEAAFSRALASAWARMESDVAQCRDAPAGQGETPAETDLLLLWPAAGGTRTSAARRERLKMVEYRQVKDALVRQAWFAAPGRPLRLSQSDLLGGVESFSVHSTLDDGERRPRTVAVSLAVRERGLWTRVLECAR